jgi:bifunctional non-homologous end joining protein LigD
MPRKTSAADPARPVAFTHPEKVYFPSGFTKGDMIRYYLEVAPFLLPHLAQRPVTLIRFPEGVQGGSFYEKNAPRHAPEWIETFPVPRHHHEGNIHYILINNAETLGWCANLGAIELHPFLHRAPAIDTPTHLAFDLDPGEGADIFTCLEVAQLLRKLFAGLGLEAWPKVSGSKGLQLYVPLNTPVTYAATGGFAKALAELLARQHPDLVVSDMAKALRKKKVLIDWSQNSQTKTTVSVYAMRAKHDAPFISMPLTWAELGRAQRKQDRDALFFTPAEALQRLRRVGDLFAPVLTTKQQLPEAFQELTGAKVTKSGVRESLRRYHAKRDFAVTAEPRGETAKAGAPRAASRRAKTKSAPPGERLRFVVQKHAASHLHYDFRLEMEGTLKSWAVPKGPPYEPGVKRAAFEVEDHPLDYMTFEGTIPKGQYGGGTVMVWDLGTYELLGGSHAKGDLKLRLHGKKLRGEWHLFRIRRDEAKPLWLLVKSGPAAEPVSPRRDDMSVLTRRSMARIARDNDAQWDSARGAGSATTTRRAARRVKRRPRARRAVAAHGRKR